MTSPRDEPVSVVVGIATCNRARWLRTAIESVLQQSQRPLRLAVVDDASSDETPALRREFPSISWERRESRQGYVRARNRMMLSGEEDYYVSLDDDAWFVDGDEIAVAVDYLERHPAVAAVAFDIMSPDHRTRAARGVATSTAMFVGCGHVLRLSVVKELGGHTEFPGAYGVEEKDLCLRLIDAGHAIVRLHGVNVWHDKTTSARDLPEQHRSGVCNDLTLALQRVPAGLVVPVVALKLSKHLVFAVRNGLLRACLRGIRDFLLAVLDVWRARRPVRLASLVQFYARSRPPRKATG